MKPQLYILTGGSRGMGLAMARQILEQGHHLLTIARQRNTDLDTTAQAHGATLTQWQQDLAQPQLAAQQLLQWLGTLHADSYSRVVLINNAGVIPPIAPLSHSDWNAISQALRVGLEAPMLLTSAFLQATEGWNIPRQVLNVSSGLGRRAIASQATYCAAKAGMDNFSVSVALDEAAKPNGALICSLAPGVIDTDMQLQLRSASEAAFPDVNRFANLKREGNLTSPQEAAARVLAWLERADFGNPVLADVRQA
jgi:NAD(P)-dependent dehydrogenase (short-subunit alcohol dehydrogenase family)